MPEIRFYHLQKQTLEEALPAILVKALASEYRAVVKLPDAQNVARMNAHLWTYRPDSFLPHGYTKEGFENDQPIWITDKDENPNNANLLVTGNGATSKITENFDLCCEMLNGFDQDDVQAARQRWKLYKEKGYEITYWQQSQTGRWEQKA